MAKEIGKAEINQKLIQSSKVMQQLAENFSSDISSKHEQMTRAQAPFKR